MKVGARPTDEQILTALGRWHGAHGQATYVVRNILAEKEFGGFDDLRTAHVLYRLRKLEAAGKVRQVPSRYKPHNFWRLA